MKSEHCKKMNDGNSFTKSNRLLLVNRKKDVKT